MTKKEMEIYDKGYDHFRRYIFALKKREEDALHDVVQTSLDSDEYIPKHKKWKRINSKVKRLWKYL